MFQQFKLDLASIFDLAKDALHIHVGLFVFFAAAALFRWPLRGPRPWLAALVVALAGEAWDLLDTFGNGGEPVYRRNWKDIWNTMLWPTAIFLLARHTRLLRR